MLCGFFKSLKSLLISFLFLSVTPALSGDLLLIQRFTSGALDTGLTPAGSRQDCSLLMLHAIDEQVMFNQAFRLEGTDPLALIKESDQAALSHMVESGTLSQEERNFYASTTRESLNPEQATYVDHLSEITPSEALGLSKQSTVEVLGKTYRRRAVLRTVSAQEVTEVSPDGGHATGFKFHPLPWMEEFPELWAEHRAKFTGKLLFEEGRGAALEKGAFGLNRMLTAWFSLRESLLYQSIAAVKNSDHFLDDTIIFGHTTITKNADKFKSEEYGFKFLGKPNRDSTHEIIYISLRDLLKRFPVEKHFPAV
ncbi:MAG: hypothetical protein EOP09_18780, partial [Proteobacteria bacterium]